VTVENDDLDNGHVTATVTGRRLAVVVLSASFDDGWTVTVDGHPQPTKMVVPALVATGVPAGTHAIVSRYKDYSGYRELFALSALILAAFAGTGAVRQRALRSPISAPPRRPARVSFVRPFRDGRRGT